MNSLKTVKNSIVGKKTNYIPTFSIMIAPSCQLLNVKQGDYSQNHEVMADTLIEAAELCGFDGVYVSRDNWVMHQALGGSMIFPEDDEPYSKETVLSTIADFKKLKVPQPENAAGMSTVLQAARRVVEKVGGKYYIQANIDVGPFTLASILKGVQNFMMDVCVEPSQLLHEYLEFCTEVVIAYGKAMIDTGVHGIQFGDAVAGLIGPQQFEEFALPYQKKAIDGLQNPHCDLWVHICGKTDHIIPYLADLNIQGFEIDALVDLKNAYKMLGSKIAVKGNLDTTFLLTETPENIFQAVQNMIRQSGLKTNLIASPGCGVPRMTPLGNLQAFAKACKGFDLSN